MRFGFDKKWFFLPALAAAVLSIPSMEGAGSREDTVAEEAAVSADSLWAMVRFLSVDPATSALRTRFTFREEPLSLVADSLASRLERYTGGTAAFLQFDIEGGAYAPDSAFTASNIAVRLEGDGSVDGAFYVTAHYDAIATHDEGWMEHWTTHPAPGANDNGTGVAALLEIARVLSERVMPFDVVFVLFTAEELGLLGSEDYVERMTPAEKEEVLGLINLDMLGYVDGGSEPGVLVVSNLSSGWLADLAIESFDRIDPALRKVLLKPGLAIFDHTPFWSAGMSAISFSEPFSEDNRVLYPYYHSAADTIGHVDFGQVERITSAVADLVASLAEAPAEASLLSSDILFYWWGGITNRRIFETGDTLVVRVRPRNTGAADPPEGAVIDLTVRLENRNGSELLYTGAFPPPPAYREVSIDLPILLGERHAGENVIHAVIGASGMDDDPSDNEIRERFSVEGGSEILLDHHVQPNPIRSRFGDALFCVNLAAETDLKVEIFDLEGELLGRAFLGSRSGTPLQAGLNCFPFGDMLPGVGPLSSGVYLYRVVLYDGNNRERSFTGRFAVEK